MRRIFATTIHKKYRVGKHVISSYPCFFFKMIMISLFQTGSFEMIILGFVKNRRLPFSNVQAKIVASFLGCTKHLVTKLKEIYSCSKLCVGVCTNYHSLCASC